ncbi:ArfGap-domain-containing protein [Rhizophagus clarus]|uniref:ArfGap-domain-containing protein n=1 Tax=Rhizophagus clarus TaxID=94130 RepID=A0A8H3LQ29_9GLOM|nr:ArfGap-domain-containing protein [Rhizophagus clarus]
MKSNRTADKSLNQKHAKILKTCLDRPENKYCADCKKKDPRWASWNLGIFVCITCSGTHRSMGTHISRVKSVDLDTWTPEQVENMVLWGNAKANLYWEANLENKRPPESNIDSWIRRKYEMKNWVKSREIPDPKTLGEQNSEDSKQEVKPKNNSNDEVDLLSSSSSISIKKLPAVSQLQGADLFSISSSSSVPSSPTQKKETPPMPRSSTPNSLLATSNSNGPTSHDNIKSSILSLYNNSNLKPQTVQGFNNYNSNYLYQQQNLQNGLSGYSNNNFGTQTTSNMNDLTSIFNQPQSSQVQQNPMPQGSQYFGAFSSQTSLSGSSTLERQTPTKADDAFSDLLGDFTNLK